MKQTIAIIVCALLSPLAFAQTSPTEDETAPEPAPFAQTTPTEEENPTTETANSGPTTPTEDENPATETAAFPQSPTEEENPVTEPSPVVMAIVNGSVLSFAADEMLVLQTTEEDPMTFVLSQTAFVDSSGNESDFATILEGTIVQVTYYLNGDQKVASRVAVAE